MNYNLEILEGSGIILKALLMCGGGWFFVVLALWLVIIRSHRN